MCCLVRLMKTIRTLVGFYYTSIIGSTIFLKYRLSLKSAMLFEDSDPPCEEMTCEVSQIE